MGLFRKSHLKKVFGKLIKPMSRQTLEQQFMPAVLEITDTPPSPLGRCIAYTIMVVFGVVVLLTCFTHIDIVAVAPGKIISNGKIKLIQPLKAGVIEEIYVSDGQRVKKGDALVKIKFEDAQNNRIRLEQELLFAQMDVLRYEALLSNDPEKNFKLPQNLPFEVAFKNKLLFQQDIEKLTIDLRVLDSQIQEVLAQIKVLKAEIQKFEHAIVNLQETVQIKKTLMEEQLVSKIQYLDLERQLIEYQETLKVNHERLGEAHKKLETLKAQRAQVQVIFQNEAAYKLQEASNKKTLLKKELENAQWVESLAFIHAPQDGVIQEMEIHTLGGIVTPAQTLMKLAPEDSLLQVEATVLNKDIGFVQAGQTARLKIDSFPYTKYGFLNGNVLFISKDAVLNEELGLVYQMRVSLEKKVMQIDENEVPLSPGMTVTVEIKTGRRRVIEYILAPFIRYQSESMRER